ncbi:MAG: hypothetical protein K6E85_15215 [Lachnospiraceae bacterium]|nr:hypothetical protein [Lachnospiraceae bacterium]
MKKKEEELFNNPMEAKIVIEDAKRDLEENEAGFKYAKLHLLCLAGSIVISVLISLLASATKSSFLLSLNGVIQTILFIALIVLTVIVYKKAGGFGDFAKMMGRFGKWGWMIVPFFPIDIIVGLGVFMFGIAALLYLTIFFLWYRKRRLNKDIALAEDYIRRYPVM